MRALLAFALTPLALLSWLAGFVYGLLAPPERG